MSNSGSRNDSDYDEQGTGTGAANASGSRTLETPTSTISSQNEILDCSNLFPLRALHEYAKGTFNPQKPLFLYASKVPRIAPPTNIKKMVDHIAGHAIFVAILG